MTTSAPPFVECDKTFAGLAVSDVSAAVEFYTTQLGFKVWFTWGGPPPTFAGVNLGKVEMFLRKGTPDPKGCCVYFHVGDADVLYEFHRAKGAAVAQEIGDREYGMRDYVVRDLNGYYLSFGHHLCNAGPPVKIERVNVPVRLEKRLAALLQDLAKHKRKRPSTTFKNSKRSTALITTAMQATGSRRSDGRSRPTILRPALMASGYGGNQSTRVLVLLAW